MIKIFMNLSILLQNSFLSGNREEELIVLASTIIIAILGTTPVGKAKTMVLKFSGDHKNSKRKELPSTRPFNSPFSSSVKDKLKYIREYGGIIIGASVTIGALLDYLVSSQDTVYDGSGIGISIALVGLLGIGLYSSVKKIKCPYCNKKHKSNQKICPETGLMLWFWEDQERIEKFRRETIIGPEEIEEFICKNYYPIKYSFAKKATHEIMKENFLPIDRNRFTEYLKDKGYDKNLKELRLHRLGD